jgi:hypothetical protein
VSDQTDAKISTLQHTILTIDGIHAPGGIRTRSASRRAAAATCLIEFATAGIGMRLEILEAHRGVHILCRWKLLFAGSVCLFLLIEGCCQLHCIALETRLYCTRSTFSNLIVSVACAFV